MPSLQLITLFITLATAAVLPRSNNVPAGSCCFTLHDDSTGAIVQQDQQSGFVYLNSDKPDGWFCIDLNNDQNVLRNEFYGACILSPDGQFSCLDPTIGFISWTLQKSGSKTLLLHDNSSAFTTCPNKLVYGQKTGSTSGCRSIKLEAKGLTGTCQAFAPRSVDA